MKLRKKIISILLVITIIALTVAPVVYAKKSNVKVKGGMPPGLLKNMLLKSNLSEQEAVDLIIENRGSLSPGILKEIILGLNLSNDSLAKLAEQGILTGLPSGIQKEILTDGDDNDDDDQVIEAKGTITAIDIADKVIEIANELYQLPVEIDVELDGQEATLGSLEVGMKVELIIENEQATIKAVSIEEITTIQGIIEDLDLIGIYHITIDDVEYKLATEVEVIINEEELTLADLEVGMNVKVKIIDNEVALIIVENIEPEVIEGAIKNLDLLGIYHITIDDVEYELSRDAQVVINGIVSVLEDLEPGMSVIVELQNEVVVKVNVKHNIKEIEGTITGIDLVDNLVVIDEVEYKLAQEVEIRLNNQEATLADLELNMDIIAVELNEKIVEINIFKEDLLEAKGKISAINLQYNTVEIGTANYQFATETIVKIDGELATLEDLIVGMLVEAELRDSKIVKIYAKNIESNIVEGDITALDLIGIYHVAIDEQEYNLLNKAIVTINEEEAQLEDLCLGMSAIVYLVDNEIVKIEATRINIARITGKIQDIDIIGVYYLKVKDKEYLLSREAQVIINENEATLQDLEIGMEANLLVEDDLVTQINASTLDTVKVEGLLTNINIDQKTIEVNEVEYSLTDEVLVLIDEVEVSLINLKVKMNVEIEINNGLVKTINANSIDQSEVLEVKGLLKAVNLEARTLTIDEKEYNLAENIEFITVNAEESSLDNLVINMNIEVEMQNNVVVKIAAKDKVEHITGEMTELLFTSSGMKLTINIVDGETVQYLVNEDLQNSNLDTLILGNYAEFKVVNNIIVEVMNIN
ncbi:hypothetical protein IMX26_17475 [Clostridium sp. 'deep sea']|uniref:hypothetical protein n=1 Tax=Clostridium sp. 'deep sea' TaxID=2779445 RepID=UPI0018965C7B|nr:hypothetical protein [Clostridium sp. 'deep sea']QOR35220.1 hypothetical protein IMX26_17475 [Clostridium sp. 'deep sea']